MGRLSTLTTMARERMTRAMRTARALADMAAQVLDWERAHRALAAAEHDRALPGDGPAAPVSSKRARAATPGQEAPPGEAAPAEGAAPSRFRDTIAASHAPRVPALASTLGPDDTLVSLPAPSHDPNDRDAGRRAPH
jgi:hypothetical protein